MSFHIIKVSKSEDVKLLRDHCCDCYRVVLWGSFKEYVFERPPVKGLEMPPIAAKHRGFLHVNRLRATEAHAVELNEGRKVVLFFWCLNPHRKGGVWVGKKGVIAKDYISVGEDIIELRYRGVVARWVEEKVYNRYREWGQKIWQRR